MTENPCTLPSNLGFAKLNESLFYETFREAWQYGRGNVAYFTKTHGMGKPDTKGDKRGRKRTYNTESVLNRAKIHIHEWLDNPTFVRQCSFLGHEYAEIKAAIIEILDGKHTGSLEKYMSRMGWERKSNVIE